MALLHVGHLMLSGGQVPFKLAVSVVQVAQIQPVVEQQRRLS